jgi:hypothetical protein
MPATGEKHERAGVCWAWRRLPRVKQLAPVSPVLVGFCSRSKTVISRPHL